MASFWFLLMMLAAFVIGGLIGHILWDGETLRWCSSPGTSPRWTPLQFPPKQIILGWYRKISNTILWHLIVAFVIRIISCIADGLSAIQPDIEGAEPPGGAAGSCGNHSPSHRTPATPGGTHTNDYPTI